MQASAFVWDDLVCLRDQPWMLQADAWRTFFVHDFCGVTNYFRPVAAALFVSQMRLFEANPAPMHLVSLALHLLNCILVWRVALALSPASRMGNKLLPCLSVLLYALHPALIEPIAWISAQTELTVTLFMLLGLLANASIRGTTSRAAAVSICFLLAACCKESAVAFPLLVALCDWTQLAPAGRSAIANVRTLLRQHWQTYLGMVLAGTLYLVLRHAQLGYVLQTHAADTLPSLTRIQEVCYLYLTYWRLMVWPMVGIGPVHLVDDATLASLSATSLLIDTGAVGIALYAAIACWKRTAGGRLVAGATVLLLPVLHLLPVTFDESLYHDRYLMAPLAFALAALPQLLAKVLAGVRVRALVLGAATTVWVACAIANIHVTLPLWSDNISLWRWALRSSPQSISARENLFAGYVMRDDPATPAFARSLVDDPHMCSICLLNVAYFGLLKNDLDLTADALARLQISGSPGFDAPMIASEDVAMGRLLEQRNDPLNAESAYRAAIKVAPQDGHSRMSLALLLARQNRSEEARRAADEALTLFPPEERDEQRSEFEQALRSPTPQP